MNAALAGLFGAWRLLLRDPAALAVFDNTPESARRSFAAAWFTLPIFLLWATVGPDSIDSRRGPLQTVLIHAIFYTLIWTVWPVAMLHIARLLDRRGRYCRYLAAYNWSMVVQAGIWLVAFLIAGAFGMSGMPVQVVTVVAVAAVLLYHVFVLKTALELDTLPAAAVAGFKFVLYQILLGLHYAALT